MNILLPLYPTDTIVRALLPETLHAAPFLRELDALGGPPPYWRVLAVSDDQDLLDIMSASGVECRRLDLCPDSENCGFLPCGAREALDLLLAEEPTPEAGEAAREDDALWCVLDLCMTGPGAPTPGGVEKALRLFQEQAPLAVASVVEVEDHPAQLDAYFRLLDVELLTLLQPEAQGPWLRTGPQIVNWETFGAEDPPAENTACILEPAADTWRLRPDDSSAKTGSEIGDVIRLLPAARGKARRLVSKDALRAETDLPVCAVPFFKALNAGSCLLLQESATQEGMEAGLYIREDAGKSVPQVRGWPLEGERLLPMDPLENNDAETDGKEQQRVLLGRTAYTGPVLRFVLPENADALAVAVLERSSGEEVDFMEPLEAPARSVPFWLVDKQTKQRSNGLTGKPITGRQDFYPLYEFDQALCLFRAGDFSGLSAAAEQGQVVGVLLTEDPTGGGS